MNRNLSFALLSLALCLLLLTGCAFFSRQAEDDTLQNSPPEQNITDLAPEDDKDPDEPEIAPDASAPSLAEPDDVAKSEPDPLPEETADIPAADSEPSDIEDAGTPSNEQADEESEQGPESDAPDAAPLSRDELHAVEDWFNKMEHNGLLRFPYEDLSDPTILAPYLEFLFYDVGETSVTAEEHALLSAAGMYTETDVFRLGRGYVMRYLLENLEIDLRTVDMETLQSIPVPGYYLEAYDAWYICHGDVMYSRYTFDGGVRRTNDTIVVDYVNSFLAILNADGEYDFLSDVEMELTLRQTSDGWRVVSHKICE